MDEETKRRFELVDDVLGHHRDRIRDLEEEKAEVVEQRDVKHGRALEWAVLLLVALEAVFTILLFFRHA